MSWHDFEIRPFNLRSASEHEYVCLNAFKNTLRGEVLPEDPPFPYTEDVQGWHTMPDFIEEATWAAWEGTAERIIALGEAFVYHTGDNEHVVEFNVGVLPEHRRKGLGRHLLGLVVEFAHNHQRRLMISASNERVPASEAFLTRIGARQGLVARTNQLRLSELNRTLIDRWMAQSHSLLDNFKTGLWDNAYPEEHIVAIAHLIEELAKDDPRDDLEVEDFNITPVILRQKERNMFATGTKRWTVYSVSRADNYLVGLTQVFWNPNRPTILKQGFTGVLPTYRNKGVGRWLKAEMMTKILRERPEVEVIRTGNANSNAPMLKINNEMGFKPYIGRAIWQVDTDTVANYVPSTA